MSPIIPRSIIILQLCAEFQRDGEILAENAVFAVTGADGERGGSDVFGYPVGISGSTVVRRG